MRFVVPITVNVQVEVGGPDSDSGRLSVDIVGACLAERIRESLIPHEGDVKVLSTEVGYPEHTGSGL